MGALYDRVGDYGRAERLFRRALKIREKSLGPHHPDVATTLDSLASLYYNRRDYGRTESLYKRALEIRQKALGPDHSDVAGSLNNLAILYDTLGDYGQAEPLYQRALKISRKVHGPHHPDVARNLNSMANLCRTLGDYRKAKTLHKRALQIRQKSLGPDHPDVANSLNNLAILWYTLGDYKRAKSLYQRALKIEQKVLGPDHDEVAHTLNNLGLLYNQLGRYKRAEPLYQRALKIRQKVLGPDHPDVGKILDNLASIYDNRGEYARAEPLYQKALEIRQKGLGPNHPHVARSLFNISRIRSASSHFKEARDLLLKALEIENETIENVLSFATEEQKASFILEQKHSLYGLLNLVSQHFPHDSGACKDAFNAWIRRKGLVLETQRHLWATYFHSDNPEVAERFREYSRVKTVYSNTALAGARHENIKAHRAKLARLHEKATQLESELGGLSPSFEKRIEIAKANATELARGLPQGRVLIDFARVPIIHFAKKSYGPAHYLVFLLHPGNGDDVELFDLGEADEIDKTIIGLNEIMVSSQSRGEVVIKLSKRDLHQMKKETEEACVRASRQVYDRVFCPFEEKLKSAREVYLVPDGQLNLIPFEVLVDTQGRYLIENYTFTYLSNSRELIGFGREREKGSPNLLIGDPDFDLEITSKKISRTSYQTRARDMGEHLWGRLDGTKKEIKLVGGLLGKDSSRIYIGKKATEDVLLEAKAPTNSTPRHTRVFYEEFSRGAFRDIRYKQTGPD